MRKLIRIAVGLILVMYIALVLFKNPGTYLPSFDEFCDFYRNIFDTLKS